jgi:hypothetical protein
MAAFTTMRQAVLAQLSATTDGGVAPVTAPTCMLMLDTHDFAAVVASANFVSDVVADEAAPTGYSRQAVTFPAPVTWDSDGRATMDFDDVGFGLLGGGVDANLGGCYILDNTGDDATSRLLYSVPFDAVKTTNGTTVTVRWSNPAARVSP